MGESIVSYPLDEIDFSKSFNADDFKCRCSSIHAMMADSRENPAITEKQTIVLSQLEAKPSLTEPQKKEMARLQVLKANAGKIILGQTCITYLLEEYAWRTQGMVRVTKELVDVPQMQKGTIVEPESLLLLSQYDEVEYKANCDENGERKRVCNDYLSGEVDAYVGSSIIGAEKIPDIKSSWDYPTFLCKIKEKITPANDFQVKGYLDISGAPEGFIGNCLVCADEGTITEIKMKLLRKTRDAATEESPIFKKRWEIIERSMRFNHMPVYQRVHKKPVEPFSSIQRQQVYDRVKICREWLNNFHEEYSKID
jgi:hypothetical protein